MPSINPFVAPTSGDQPWVDQMRKTLKTQLSVLIDTPPLSIFSVPQILKDEKPEAYAPQKIGLGLKHHFRTELYSNMQQNKLTAVERVIKPYQIPDLEDRVAERIKNIIPVVSPCYDSFPETDADAFAWLFAIDGLLLLDQLRVYFEKGFAIDEKDLIMLENQIPMVVLKEIEKALSSNGEHVEELWESKFRYFAESNSPFLLSKEAIDFNRVNHLLDYMYHSIINNEVSRDVAYLKPGSIPVEKSAAAELLEAIIKAAGLIPGVKPFLGIIESIIKILYQTDKEKMIQEIRVPSVSELGDIARVKFALSTKEEGIRNISFANGTCCLPVITLNYDSEVILRNLMAYEKLMAKNSLMGGFGLELTEYVDFMCGIIDTANDVKVLRELKIIQGDLPDEEIVKLFNGIGRSLGNMSGQSMLRQTVAELNKVYDNVLSVRIKKEAEKQARAVARALTFLVSISGTLVLAREALVQASGSKMTQLIINIVTKQMAVLFRL
ncbi:hypothetical protein HanRHA438_Chr10g0474261 [Helianthus annuus]|uniref:Uncharacterized protein n=1 Tax=Helianthus annuus TaxID=4232 RepID=A0A251TQD6_HELAN|nr:putative UPF0481 protein At3g02645 [Helianthus annuus]KAF5788243.1 hypothetical protein HanXRQr2_Chr10g0461851 [Helianthus annuus]KAJ0515312.1 hypothetical protein HanHA300_Chr10g0379241 [Helianthus annuus]KAJ0523791.1 hypothetical protein HanIR_Chr10g0497631 [Helianthus annuus]KAJ0531507.1 hypothetical protein HanHA89_Chr10g0401821 [Helianthus annuus]KAJ0698348.1 hypothetical protein HanLR1_Chr10g0379041 [Helianthus annuus]